MNQKLIGQNIREIRKANNITQAQLAEEIQVSVVHIAHIEAGTALPSVKKLIEICEFLRVTPNDILLGEYIAPDVENLLHDIAGNEKLAREDMLLMQYLYNYLETRKKSKETKKDE